MITAVYILSFGIFGFFMSRRLHNRLLLSLLLCIYGAILSVSRQHFDTGDLPNYVIGFLDFDWSPYFLKSPLFWLIGRSINLLLGDPRLTFLTMDLIILALLRSSFNGKLGILITFVFFSFPFVLGFTNIYRQLLATVFLLKAFSIELDKPGKFNLYFIFASLIHITVIPFVAIYYYLRFFRRFPLFMFIFGLAIVGIVVQYNLVITAVAAAGGTVNRGNTEFIYIGLFLVCFVSTLCTLKNNELVSKDILLASFFFFLLGVYFLTVAPSSSGTRIIMISLVVQNYLIVYSARQLDTRSLNKTIVAGSQVLLMAMPAMISPSAWHLLFGYQL